MFVSAPTGTFQSEFLPCLSIHFSQPKPTDSSWLIGFQGIILCFQHSMTAAHAIICTQLQRKKTESGLEWGGPFRNTGTLSALFSLAWKSGQKETENLKCYREDSALSSSQTSQHRFRATPLLMFLLAQPFLSYCQLFTGHC